jgi:hypothetical protein
MMPEKQPKKQIPLPKGWPETVKSAVLHVISLAQFATAFTRGWAADSPNGRMRLTAKNDRVNAETAILREEVATPKNIVCDRGPQFDCDGFKAWCRHKGIKPPRYGAVGKHGSIAVVERFILTLKKLSSALLLIPYNRDAFQRELDAVISWYNESRPHTWLRGKTPDEVYHGSYPANRKPRFEPRAAWPRESPCARPWALVRGSPGARLELKVSYHYGRRHLPIVTLVRAA